MHSGITYPKTNEQGAWDKDFQDGFFEEIHKGVVHLSMTEV